MSESVPVVRRKQSEGSIGNTPLHLASEGVCFDIARLLSFLSTIYGYLVDDGFIFDTGGVRYCTLSVSEICMKYGYLSDYRFLFVFLETNLVTQMRVLSPLSLFGLLLT